MLARIDIIVMGIILIARLCDVGLHQVRKLEALGPYLAERQRATIREDYSADGSCWEYFPTIMPAAGPTVGEKMDCSESQTGSAAFVLPWPFGTKKIRFSMNDCSG